MYRWMPAHVNRMQQGLVWDFHSSGDSRLSLRVNQPTYIYLACPVFLACLLMSSLMRSEAASR